MRIEQLTETEVAYIAGLIDGEGTISMTAMTASYGKKKARFRTTFTVAATTSTELVSWLVSKFGVGAYEVGRPRSPKHLQGWCFKISECRGEELLRRCLPYLVIKKRHAELYLRYREIQKACYHKGSEIRWSKESMRALRSVREWFYHEFRELNAKGPVTVEANTSDTISEQEVVKIESELQGNLQRVSGDTAPPTVIQ